MWLLHARRPQADSHALERIVLRAGLALACPYSTAEEFEAAVIHARRRGGAPKRYRRRAAAGAVAAAVLGLLAYWLI
jgi:hypothetical protein